MKQFTLGKYERLKHRSLVEKLFREGKAYKDFPLLLLVSVMELPSSGPVQAAFSVSKRNVRKAHRRTAIKRLLREAWRTNKTPVYQQAEEGGKQLALAFLYVGKELPDYDLVVSKILALNQRLIEDIPNLSPVDNPSEK